MCDISNTILDINYEITKIIHISDIHIKSSNRELLDSVFNEFYKFLKKECDDKSIVYIGGDLIDNETDPICITITKNFIYNITKITRCLMIIGNHDININNRTNDIDKITAIIDKLESVKPYYIITKNGNYEFKNIIFTFTDLFSNKITQPFVTDKLKIGLYHGRIKEVMDIKDNKTNSSYFAINDFMSNNFDFVLLGDIHKRMVLENTQNKMIYSGSMYQTRISECYEKGGYVINLENKNITPFNIKNDKAYFRILIDEDGNINVSLKDIPKIVNIQFINKCNNDDIINKIIKLLIDEGIIIINFITVNKNIKVLDTTITLDERKYDLLSINSADELNALIIDNIKKHNGIEPNSEENLLMMEMIGKIITDERKNIFMDEKKKIDIKKLEFSNISCYGENNYIDFATLSKHGSIFLYGENDLGKTTIIDAINIGLYGCSIKIGVKEEFLNENKKNGYVEICIQVNDDEYIIRREFSINLGAMKHYVLIMKNGFNVTQKDIMTSNNYINDNICSMEDINSIMFVNQKHDNSLLIDKNKYKKILKYAGLNKFIIIEEACFQLHKQYYGINSTHKTKLKNLLDINSIKTDFDYDLNLKITKIECDEKELKEKINRLKQNQEELIFQLDIEQQSKAQNTGMIKGFNMGSQFINIGNISTINENDILIKTYERENTNLISINRLLSPNTEYNCGDIENKRQEYLNEISREKTKINENIHYDISIVNSKKEIQKINKKMLILEKIINKINKQTYTKKQVEGLFIDYGNMKILSFLNDNSNEHNKNLFEMMKNKYIKTDIEKIKSKYNTFIESKFIDKSKYNEYISLLDECKKMKDDLNTHIVNIRTNKKITEYEKIIIDIDKYRNNLIVIEKNVSKIKALGEQNKLIKIYLENELCVNDCNKKINDSTIMIEKLNKKINENKEELKKLYDIMDKHKIHYDGLKTHIKDYNETKKIYIMYEKMAKIIYTNITKKILEEKILPKLANNVNIILENLKYDGINILFESETKNISIKRKNSSSSAYKSGSFFYGLFDLIFKIGLSKINEYLVTNVLFIDEICDSASNTNKGKMNDLISHLKTYYGWLFIISHDDTLKNTMDCGLNITKKNNFSNILFPADFDISNLSKLNATKYYYESKKEIKNTNEIIQDNTMNNNTTEIININNKKMFSTKKIKRMQAF